MPSLSFKLQFCDYVEDGSKAHSIRAGERFKVGDVCHLFYAMRTKQCRLLGRARCIKVSKIRIERARVWIDGEELSLDEKNLLAWNDGFRHRGPGGSCINVANGCFDLMLEFWAKNHGDTVFEGQIVFWDWAKHCKCEKAGFCENCTNSKGAKR